MTDEYKNDIKKTDKKIVNICLDIDYNTYKNRIKKYIFNHIKYIYDIYTEEYNDSFAKLYILNKKGLLENDDKKYCDMLIDLYNKLKEINCIDQEEYLILILKLLNIYIYINNTVDNQKKDDKEIDLKNVKMIGNKYINLIDKTKINNKIHECIEKIRKDNIIMEIFILFIKKENKDTKNNIIFISEKLSIDYFMYWNSKEIYEIIKENINNSKNRLLTSIKKYKNEFINTYNNKTEILRNIYVDVVNSKMTLKYKFIKENELFNELIKDINAIDNNINKK
jgi:hypothetical protein